jgi:hypothetical protein
MVEQEDKEKYQVGRHYRIVLVDHASGDEEERNFAIFLHQFKLFAEPREDNMDNKLQLMTLKGIKYYNQDPIRDFQLTWNFLVTSSQNEFMFFILGQTERQIEIFYREQVKDGLIWQPSGLTLIQEDHRLLLHFVQILILESQAWITQIEILFGGLDDLPYQEPGSS